MSGFEPLLIPIAGAVGKLAFKGLRKCYKKYQQFKHEKENKVDDATDPVELALQKTEKQVDQRYDRFAVLGPKFVQGDCKPGSLCADLNPYHLHSLKTLFQSKCAMIFTISTERAKYSTSRR
jgi:hypothetical protein